MVVTPDEAVYDELVAAAPMIASFDGGDTGFLNAFFPQWYGAGPEARLPFGYNAQRTLHWLTHAKQPGYWEAVRPLKVVHFSSSPKPWECGRDERGRRTGGELELLWWRVRGEQQAEDMRARAAVLGGGAAAALLRDFLG